MVARAWDGGAVFGKMETFKPLFPFGHSYQGFMDLFSWKNGTDLALRVEIKPSESWSTELDLSAKYNSAKNTLLWFGYSRFFTGDFVAASGASEDSDWIWAQLTATF
ncbi:MAG: hypothetical protein EXS14_07070 [Planctomycetes bacterium]|nr:hypothetical protein [Planctomycetota bacterium]